MIARKYLKLIYIVILLLGVTLACKTVTNAFAPDAPPPSVPATEIGSAPTDSPTAASPVNTTGVRACDYVPGVSIPAQMPPEVIATPTPYIYPTFEPPTATTVDAATTTRQLEMFNELWQIVNEYYVYTDFNGLDWEAVGDRYETLIKKGLSDEDFYAAMSEMIFELGDEHSGFQDPEAVKESEKKLAGQNNFVGIGAYVLPVEDMTAGVIITVFPNSPAAKANLKPHDKITGVDGGPLFDEVTLKSRTLGIEGTPVTITMERLGEAPRELTLIRASIAGNWPIDYCVIPSTHIGYIFLPTFYDETISDQVRTALEEMTSTGPLDGLIIDVRTNQGGSVQVGAEVLGFFTEGVNGYFVSRSEKRPYEIFAEDINDSQEVPLVIIVEEGTASMGEIFSGILRLTNRAQIVGRNTLGNMEVLSPFAFDDGSRAWIAAETFEPVGEAAGIWERTGIVPDVSVPTRWDLFTEANDPALAAAVELLQKGK